MPDLSFPWIFIGFASLVDLVGFFYLWRRRKSVSGTNHTPVRNVAPRFLAERRRKERRGTDPPLMALGQFQRSSPLRPVMGQFELVQT
jgi:hypothetical protein